MNCTNCRENKASQNCECCNVRLCSECTNRDAEGTPFCSECHALLVAEGEGE